MKIVRFIVQRYEKNVNTKEANKEMPGYRTRMVSAPSAYEGSESASPHNRINNPFLVFVFMLFSVLGLNPRAKL